MHVPPLSRLGIHTSSQPNETRHTVGTLFEFDETFLVIQNMIQRMAEGDDSVRSICENVVNMLVALRVHWRHAVPALAYSQHLFYVTIKELLVRLGNVQERDAAEAMYDILNYFDDLPQDLMTQMHNGQTAHWQIDSLLSDGTGRPVDFKIPFPIFATLCNFISYQLAVRRVFQYVSDFMHRIVSYLQKQSDSDIAIQLQSIQTIAFQVSYKLQNLPMVVRYSDVVTDLRVKDSSASNSVMELASTDIYIPETFDSFYTGTLEKSYRQIFNFFLFYISDRRNIMLVHHDDGGMTFTDLIEQIEYMSLAATSFGSMLDDPARHLSYMKHMKPLDE